MKFFKLPDLGEGLQEAEIVEWHVNVGDTVKTDDLLVSVETEKAIVDIPCPQDGKIVSIFCEVGELLNIGEPLVEFEGEEEGSTSVVGDMKVAGEKPKMQHSFVIGRVDSASNGSNNSALNVTPAVRALASRLNVNLALVKGSGPHKLITSVDVEKAHKLNSDHGQPDALKGVTRSMAKNMARAHSEVPQVTIFDDANISHWQEGDDTILKLVEAIAYACSKHPKLNAKFDGELLSLQLVDEIDLGVAVDTEDGLFVPVLRNINNRKKEDINTGLKNLRRDVENRSIPASELRGSTITLSNFGTLGGRYATPIVVPPSVAIIGAGTTRKEPLVVNDEIKIQTVLPLSLSFDHRPITGGEAARFLKALKHSLEN